MPIPRPSIMSSRSDGANPYASVAPVLGGEEPGRLGTASGEGGDLPYWLGWGGRSPPVKVVSCSGRPAMPVKVTGGCVRLSIPLRCLMVTSASALLMILLAFRIPPLWWQVLESVWYALPGH